MNATDSHPARSQDQGGISALALTAGAEMAAHGFAPEQLDPTYVKTQAQAARWLNVTVPTLIAEVRAGRIRPFYVRRRVLYTLTELIRYANAQMEIENPKRNGGPGGRPKKSVCLPAA
jgi:hypothetical protein